MRFTQIEFVAFFGLVLLGLRLARTQRMRNTLLLLASYYFYAYWDWRFLWLIVLSTLANYVVALDMERTGITASRRRWLLVASVMFNLGMLGFFKYRNFFGESMQRLLAPWGLRLGTLRYVLPIGISFYTLTMMSYIIDVYRGQLRPCRSLLEYALFVAFFPRLVAGPIVRGTALLPQLRSHVRMSWHDAFLGFRQFTLGLFKKVFIADRLAVFVDYAFENAGLFDTASTWLAVIAYGVQIYCDFSGYSDMAIGTARIMGYRLPRNFNAPYLATSITEFWHRWHITLSTWLRDYVYIPLGGNRKGRLRGSLNILAVMTLGGLWHGASWTFVVWGLLHGCALVGEKCMRSRWRPTDRCPPVVAKAVGWSITMLVVFTAWVFFGASSFEQAFLMLRQLLPRSGGIAWYHPFTISALLALTVIYVLIATGRLSLQRLTPERVATPTLLFSMWWLVLAFPAEQFSPFIYSQF